MVVARRVKGGHNFPVKKLMGNIVFTNYAERKVSGNHEITLLRFKNKIGIFHKINFFCFTT